MSKTISSGMRTSPGEIVENLGKNWRMSMKRKNLEGKKRYD